MSTYWHLEDEQRDSGLARLMPNLDAALQERGQRVSGADDSTCQVDAWEVGVQRYFLKRYRASDFSLGDYLGRSKVRREWDNLLLFRRLGISTPEPVAIGERRLRGRFREGVLISAEIPGAVDMGRIMDSDPHRFRDRAWFDQLCRQLALPLRKLHDYGFAHNDLNWRNVLITEHPQLRVYFFDCPTGRRWIWPFRDFRIAKDLAHLDKMGRRYLSRTQRLRFFLYYRGHARLDAADKKVLRRVLGRVLDAKYTPDRDATASPKPLQGAD